MALMFLMNQVLRVRPLTIEMFLRSTLYKYMRLIDPNWRHVYNMMLSREFLCYAVIYGATHYIVAYELSTTKQAHAILNTYTWVVRHFSRPKQLRSDNAFKHNEVEVDIVNC
ncbi:hypothetical protein SELMODRAFT_416308 [Selaginella moellendorffii]|uniref:Uncharacterized protein n=1 Tax=Selaginella moellendorffii TaxID=88036 RepID=D8RYV9_SELML|nr:hypothetical protein SELMODRAFT_416308 [Selaginella moellendorffii]